VAIDREATLKKAEKLLRQGKLDGAIAEYVRLVEEQPKDWNSINALGDLYVRANQIDNAVAQFTRIADYLYAEGFLPKAAAVYKKILKIKAEDEHTMLRVADIAAQQGVLVDAKTYYRQVADRRRAKGDDFGASQIVMRIGELDPADAELKIQAARAAESFNDVKRATTFLIEAADAYEKQKRVPDALAALTQAVALDPEDAALRGRLLTGLVAQRQIAQARSVARTANELVTIAETLEQEGQTSEALELLTEAVAFDSENVALRNRLMTGLIGQGRLAEAKAVARTPDELVAIAELLEREGKKREALEVLTEAAQRDPSNLPLRARLAKEWVAAGDVEQARIFLTAETVGDDPELLMMLARFELQSGRIEEGKSALNRLLALSPNRREELVFVATDLADKGQVDAAFACVDLAADAALLEQDWGGAAAALHEFVTRVPNQIPALMKLVEICVDGGLESTMHMAQAQLADAYLATGLGAEARVIAEDLVAREPWVKANIERFRRALMMLGVPDPDAVIAERLSGESPFLSTIDLEMPREERSTQTPPSPGPKVDVDVLPDLPELPPMEEPPAAAPIVPPFLDAPPPPPRPRETDEHEPITLDSVEIDLSDALTDLKPAHPLAAPGRPAPPLEEVFDEMRTKAMRESQLQAAQAQYAAAIDHATHGRLDEAIIAFETAARVPLMRFQAGTRLGRLHIARGDLPRGVEWLERAAEAPAPTVDEGHAVMFELADALERVGESARALAVLLELHADAGNYRDVSTRIDRLSKVQAGR
jgi:tetratricopeptide (TPR) repeat protein